MYWLDANTEKDLQKNQQHPTLHSPLHTPHSPHSTLHSPLSIHLLHTPNCQLHAPLSPLSTLHSPHSTLHSPHSTPHTPHFTLQRQGIFDAKTTTPPLDAAIHSDLPPASKLPNGRENDHTMTGCSHSQRFTTCKQTPQWQGKNDDTTTGRSHYTAIYHLHTKCPTAHNLRRKNDDATIVARSHPDTLCRYLQYYKAWSHPDTQKATMSPVLDGARSRRENDDKTTTKWKSGEQGVNLQTSRFKMGTLRYAFRKKYHKFRRRTNPLTDRPTDLTLFGETRSQCRWKHSAAQLSLPHLTPTKPNLDLTLPYLYFVAPQKSLQNTKTHHGSPWPLGHSFRGSKVL